MRPAIHRGNSSLCGSGGNPMTDPDACKRLFQSSRFQQPRFRKLGAYLSLAIQNACSCFPLFLAELRRLRDRYDSYPHNLSLRRAVQRQGKFCVRKAGSEAPAGSMPGIQINSGFSTLLVNWKGEYNQREAQRAVSDAPSGVVECGQCGNELPARG